MPNVTTTYNTTTVTYDQSSLSYDGFDAPLSNMPAVGVFIAWSGNPYEFVPTGGWTEISQYVRSINIRRGRQDDLQQFPPGTASLVLDNRDRLFDPLNSSSVPLRTNLVTNPSFETGTTSWMLQGTATGSIAQSSTFAAFGTSSCLMSITGSGVAWLQTNVAGNIPVTAGQTYSLSAYARSSVSRTCRVIVQWRNASNVLISNSSGVSASSSTSDWTRFTVTGTAPSGAVSAVTYLETSNAVNGDAIYWDAVLFEAASSIGEYFDGSLNSRMGFGTPAWTGTANASTSVLYKYPAQSQVAPRKQIKIVANWNGVEYPLYRGYIAGWPVEYTEAGLDSTVTIDCFDLLGLLGSSIVKRNLVEDVHLATNPTLYFPLSENPNLNSWLDRVSGAVAWSQPGVTFVSPTGQTTYYPWTTTSFELTQPLSRGTITSALTLSNQEDLTPLELGGVTSDGPSQDFSLSFLMRPSNRTIALPTLKIGNCVVTFGLDSASQGGWMFVENSAATSRSRVAFDFRTNNTYHIVITFNNTTKQFQVFVDGVSRSGVLASGGDASIVPYSYSYAYLARRFQLQHIAIWTRVLTTTDIQTIYQAFDGRIDQTSFNRYGDSLIKADVPSNLYSISSACQTIVSDVDPASTPLIPTLQKVNAGELGEIFVDDLGVLQIYGRDDVFNKVRSNTSQMTFTDSGVGVDYDAGSVRLDFNADQVRNNLTFSASNGGEVNVTDATSVTNFGNAAEKVDTFLRSATDATTAGQRLVTVYKNPQVKVEPFMVKGQQDSAYNWPRLLALELLDKVTFKRTPSVGSAVSKDLLVQSIEHRITPGEWQTVVNGSGRWANWFVLGVSLLGSDDLLIN